MMLLDVGYRLVGKKRLVSHAPSPILHDCRASEGFEIGILLLVGVN